VTPRGTDWSLAALVAVLGASGLAVVAAGRPDRAWVYAVHGIAGFALGGILVWKLRRVARRVGRRPAGTLALGLVGLALLTGWIWSGVGHVSLGGFTLLAWHDALGAVLVLAVLVHAIARRPRAPRRADVHRRAVLQGAGVGVFAFLAWRAQRPVGEALGLPAADRRFTGSYEAASFEGNAFPETSWVADDPRELGAHPVRVTGAVRRPLTLAPAELDAGDELDATLDCTGGFHSRQRWRGVRLDRLLRRAGARGSHLRVVSHTGYRWSFDRRHARRLLLATHVGDEPLSHGHGAPVRLVAPGRRGYQWVKWVVRVEVHDGPDPGAPASTIWSSFTPEGRGEA
jgi:DMSO/TMAO reductase YedYZ molybdopterin-dependent catalytic subunit